MDIVNSTSLAATIDAVNETFFYERPLSKSQKENAARWIAERQGRPGSYAEMFAPTENDLKEDVRVFTGEKLRSRAATEHILGEEACRALIPLDVPDTDVRNALTRATQGMINMLTKSESMWGTYGMYCCGTCTCSLWRHLTAGGLHDAKQRLLAGMKTLNNYRDGRGRWRRFPFYYTLLALSEIDLPPATEEMRYAVPACERSLKRTPGDDKYSQRRRDLIQKILAKS